MDQPGPLLASGRDSEIFEAGAGRVVRKARDGRSLASEARLMSYVHAEGYPVPEVYGVSDDGTAVTMERVEGPTLLAHVETKPWRVRSTASLLADLHKRLHAIRAPEWLGNAPGSAGDRLVHLDLHPLNVIMSSEGPVVIDWPNARRGNPAADVAATWALLSAGEVPGDGWQSHVVGRFRGVFVSGFLRNFVMAPVRAELAEIVEWKCRDPNMGPGELEALRELARREARK